MEKTINKVKLNELKVKTSLVPEKAQLTRISKKSNAILSFG